MSRFSRRVLKPKWFRADLKEGGSGAGVEWAGDSTPGCWPARLGGAPWPLSSARPRTVPSWTGPVPTSQSTPAPSCLEFLLDNGADPSLRDRQGYTAVHYAAAYGNRQNLELVRVGSGPG